MNDDSASDLTHSSTPAIGTRHAQCSKDNKRPTVLIDVPPNAPLIHKSRPHKKPSRLTPTASTDSHSSFASNATSRLHSAVLSHADSDKFRQRIEEQYKLLQISEARYRYYIDDRSISLRAEKVLKQAVDGTYFLRPAEADEQQHDVAYILHFVCHNEVANVPICYNQERRTYCFLSGYGFGSEVRREYTGIDLLIHHKQENNFYELSYPFKICLSRPIELPSEQCIPLPDEIRILDRQNTILHELATHGLSNYFNELISISKNNSHSLQSKAEFIRNKINGRNKQGLTPLILAIQARQYHFVELLLNNNADIDMIDGEGCSPFHHACRQANHKMLVKLIDRKADPHYFSRRQTNDGTFQSHLAAFHYLAMTKGATTKTIKQCASYLLKCGCPLMPLTKEGKSPFDIAYMYNNLAYECVKIFCDKRQFNNILPIEVSSRNDAKTMLEDLACPSMLGKIRLSLKKCDNRRCFGKDGLFLFYKTRRSKTQPDEEYGLCVHAHGKVFTYRISEKYKSRVLDLSRSPPEIVYNYSLITDTPMDDHVQMIVFKTYEDLIYNHSEYKGILPTVLTAFVRKEYGEYVIIEIEDLPLPIDPIISGSGYQSSDPDDDDDSETDIDVESIDRIELSDIHSGKLLDENRHRLIWLAKVRFEQTKSFPIIIKDYLPNKDMDLYKTYRLNEFQSPSEDRSNHTTGDFPYTFSSRSRIDYKHESKLLLNDLKNHPFIVHTFTCNHRPRKDLRVFMEYLPCGNLHSYLIQLKPDSLDPLINAFHWIYQLAQVMAFLTGRKIVHRDLAARNILMKHEQYIKLSDFGLSRFEGVELDRKDCIISPPWTAPECFDRQQNISSLSDVWSFGIVIWEIYTFGGKPYDREMNNNVENNSQQLIRFLKRFLIEQGRRLPKPDTCSAGMYDLMCRCWNGDMSKRPRFVDIIDDFNGMSRVKECLIPFTHDERKIWKEAKEEYLSIHPVSSRISDANPAYVSVEDHENEDNGEVMQPAIYL